MLHTDKSKLTLGLSALALMAAGVLLAPPAAQARVGIGLNLNVPGPVVAAPPVVVAPPAYYPPAYYAPGVGYPGAGAGLSLDGSFGHHHRDDHRHDHRHEHGPSHGPNQDAIPSSASAR